LLIATPPNSKQAAQGVAEARAERFVSKLRLRAFVALAFGAIPDELLYSFPVLNHPEEFGEK
jgi:hypothetical protein